MEYRLVRNGGVLLEFVKHLQRYIKTSVNLRNGKFSHGVRQSELEKTKELFRLPLSILEQNSHSTILYLLLKRSCIRVRVSFRLNTGSSAQVLCAALDGWMGGGRRKVQGEGYMYAKANSSF